jgi:hypothetical protein
MLCNQSVKRFQENVVIIFLIDLTEYFKILITINDSLHTYNIYITINTNIIDSVYIV